MATQPAPRVPAGKGSLAALAILYSQHSALEDKFDEAIRASALRDDHSTIADASRASWDSRMHNARVIMEQPPQNMADLLITIGMASAYIDGIITSVDCRERTILGGVQSALDNAFKFLIGQGATDGMPIALSPLIEEFCRNTGAPERGPAPRAEAA